MRFRIYYYFFLLLYTQTVPQEEALRVFEEDLFQDRELKNKTPITASKLMKLFRTCLKKTCLKKTLYLQIDGLGIGASSPVLLAELLMMKLEQSAIESFAHPPQFWFRCVDDTFTSLLGEYIELFLKPFE